MLRRFGLKALLETRRQEGQVLLVTVVMMLVLVLIIPAFLHFVGSGLEQGTVIEDRTRQLYVADAGVESAIAKIMQGNLPASENTTGSTFAYSISSINNLTANVHVTLTYQSPDHTSDNYTLYSQTSEPNGRNTWITAKVSSHKGPFYNFLDNIITTGGDLTVTGAGASQTTISGNISAADDPHKGYSSEWVGAWGGGWPTKTELEDFYGTQVAPVSSSSWLSPNPPSQLTGPVYISGDLDLSHYSLDLKHQTLFVDGNFTYKPQQGQKITAPGVIVATGNIEYWPNTDTGDQFNGVLLVALGTLDLQPGGNYYGWIASEGGVTLRQGNGPIYQWMLATDNLNLDFPGLDAGGPGSPAGQVSVLTWDIAYQASSSWPYIVTTSPLINGEVGAAYNQTVTASGGITPYTWSISSGSLPAGLTIGASSGVISGTPTSAGTSSFTVQVTDSTHPSLSAVQNLSITINSGVTITTGTLPSGVLNVLYYQAVTASGGITPYAWSIPSGLPPGLTIDGSSGVIAGTPTGIGPYSFTVHVTDTFGSTATKSLSITINAPLSVSTTSLPSVHQSGSYNQSVSATGGISPYSWTISGGTLPTGLTLSSAGVISGTPTTAGIFNFTVQVTDSASPTPNTANKALSIVVIGPTITTTSLPDGYLNASYSQTLNATGGTTPYTWARTSGSLPTGLTLSSGGVISGTATAAGTFSFTVQVTDSYSPHGTATQALTITIDATLSVSTSSLPNGAVGSIYGQSLAATGGKTPYSWTKTGGSLPGGLSLNSAGVISGNATATGTFSFTVQVTDSFTPTPHTATKSLSITVNAALGITTSSLPNGHVGVAYSQTLNASGGTTPYTWTISAGSLPAGLTLSSGGTISGTPTAGGVSNFTVMVTDSGGNSATKAFSITIPTPPAVTTNAASNVAKYSATLNGTLTALGASNSVTLSFDWGTDTNYTGGNVAATPSSWSGAVPEAFSYNLTGLSHKTDYHFRAKAVAADGSIVYGVDVPFTTTN